MRESLRDFIIGLCAIVATAGLIALLFLFDEIDSGGGWSFTLRTRDAAGIFQGSQVTLNGVPAGRISTVQLVPDGEAPVKVTVQVDPDTVIPRNVTFQVKDSLLGSSGRLAMVTTSWQPDDPTIKPGDTITVDQIPSQMMVALGQELDNRFGTLLESWATVGTRLAVLLGDSDTDEETITGTVRRVNALLEQTARWIDNPTLLANAEDLMRKVPTMMDRTIGATEDLTRLLRTLNQRSDEVGIEVAATARNLRELLDASTKLTNEMRAGEGTIGQMVQNPDLYNSLDAAANRLDKLIVDVQLLIEQMREEGIGPLIF
ncbi:MAG: MlaD family protein [Phycisphaerales bacterium]|nr:MlaD family protein [Phycisphaerales bacterium]